MSHREPPPRSRIRVRWGRVSALLAVLVLAGYVAACALAPIPNPAVELSIEAEQITTAGTDDVQAIVDGEKRPTAVGWAGGDQVWTNSNEAAPIASITKLITALVGLEERPIEPGGDGETHVWSDADIDRQNEYLAENGIVFPIAKGTEVTEREMLTMALLPSANDFAAAYANSVFGDNETFVAAVDAWKEKHGLDTLTIAEPTGLDERNAASPADLVRIGQLAVANPIITEITSQKSAELPWLPWDLEEVNNTNPLLKSLPGTVGLKTGYTTAAGHTLLAAQEGEAGAGSKPRPVTKIAATLDRPSAQARASATSAALKALDGLEQEFELVEDGEPVGTATTIDGAVVPLVADGSANALLLPGETATVAAQLHEVAAGPAGQPAGDIEVTAPSADDTVLVITGAEIVDPDFWWRLTHPHLLFG